MSWLHTVIDVPTAHLAAMVRFWESASGWPLDAPWSDHPELRSFEPEHGRPYLHVQEVEGSPHVHLDVETDDVDTTVARGVDLGAVLVDRRDRWQVLESPGLLPFCVLAAGPHHPPDAVSWPEGHRSRLVQVCIDSPVEAHDDEVAFWRSVLPGRWARSAAQEFAGKWHDDAGSPPHVRWSV